MKQDLSIAPYDILTLLLSMPDNNFRYSIISTNSSVVVFNHKNYASGANSRRDIFLSMFTNESHPTVQKQTS